MTPDGKEPTPSAAVRWPSLLEEHYEAYVCSCSDPDNGDASSCGKPQELPPETGTIANYYKQTVYTPKEEKIGEIDDVLVDKAGKITAFIVGVGGFLGVGERNVRRTLQLGKVNEEE